MNFLDCAYNILDIIESVVTVMTLLQHQRDQIALIIVKFGNSHSVILFKAKLHIKVAIHSKATFILVAIVLSVQCFPMCLLLRLGEFD